MYYTVTGLVVNSEDVACIRRAGVNPFRHVFSRIQSFRTAAPHPVISSRRQAARNLGARRSRYLTASLVETTEDTALIETTKTLLCVLRVSVVIPLFPPFNNTWIE